MFGNKKQAKPEMTLEVTEVGKGKVSLRVTTANKYSRVVVPPGFSEVQTGREGERIFVRDMGNGTTVEVEKVIREWVEKECTPYFGSFLKTGARLEVRQKTEVKVTLPIEV